MDTLTAAAAASTFEACVDNIVELEGPDFAFSEEGEAMALDMFAGIAGERGWPLDEAMDLAMDNI